MKNHNLRIIKKLSKRATMLLPQVDWDSTGDEPYCSKHKNLKDGTPVVWYRCCFESSEYDSICGWEAIKQLFENEKYSAHFENREWYFGEDPTPRNVFFWAGCHEADLKIITENRFNL